MHFLITGALNISNSSSIINEQRKIEYILCLHKIFNYNLPVHMVLSECNELEYKSSYFNMFNYTTTKIIENTEILGANTKSQKEFLSISEWIKNAPSIDDSTWIIKLCGRYLLLDDFFITTVKSLDDRYNAVLKIIDNTLGCTFCFAMRWKYFKDFYSKPIELLGEKCVENFMIEYIIENKLTDSTINISNLGILTNIANDNKYTIY